MKTAPQDQEYDGPPDRFEELTPLSHTNGRSASRDVRPFGPDSEPVRPLSDWADHPLLAVWEVTRACGLVCRHCRAEAQPRRHPLELTTDEGKQLIDDIAASGTPLLIFTGGDPAMRPDLTDLVRHAIGAGLRVGVSPSATPRLKRDLVFALREAGATAISLSLDGSCPEIHDGFRGITGTFERTLKIAQWATEAGFALQINTTVCKQNQDDLENIVERVKAMKARTWTAFFLVPTGRATSQDMLSAPEHERVYAWLYELSKRVDFTVSTTEGQPFRRYALMQLEKEGLPYDPAYLRGVADGRGFCFISHIGNVCPSGFLELPAGNVRRRSFTEIYRESPLFRTLRDPDRLTGKCGRCRFRFVCGGSRARAYNLTGDVTAADPTCPYIPELNASRV